MAQEEFDFTGLKEIYRETLLSFDKTTAFDIQIGKGRFLFMLFLSSEDKDAKDMLFIYMRNTAVLCKLKMYGNHKSGCFHVYINEKDKEKFILELQLEGNGGKFYFQNFLSQINAMIPVSIDDEHKAKTIRANKQIVRSLNVVDESKKTILIGQKSLPTGQKPRDKTLRKLFLYTDAPVKVVKDFVKVLKATNSTVAWTTEDRKNEAVEINVLLTQFNEE